MGNKDIALYARQVPGAHHTTDNVRINQKLSERTKLVRSISGARKIRVDYPYRCIADARCKCTVIGCDFKIIFPFSSLI